MIQSTLKLHISKGFSEILFNSKRMKEDFKLLPIIHSSFYAFLPHILKGWLLVKKKKKKVHKATGEHD